MKNPFVGRQQKDVEGDEGRGGLGFGAGNKNKKNPGSSVWMGNKGALWAGEKMGEQF